jgi:UDP-N-acetylglucosamine--N-acetylmuramyl-(pentapeptide) pyrophosphoryl-undecaprenol N-acetylglucosamine transferase
MLQSMWHLLAIRPKLVLGMGGYISVPPVVCGWILRRRTVIFNADSVLGNANILLKRFADKIALTFPDTKGAPADSRAIVTGLPLRPEILAKINAPYAGAKNGIAILVMGGSQGHRMLDAVPGAIAMLPQKLRARINVLQQAMEPDVKAVSGEYERAGVRATVMPFFKNSAEMLANASLFIGLAGANTVYEIGSVGRPAIFVPLNHRDRQQFLNASKIASNGGARIIEKRDLSPKRLSKILLEILSTPNLLENMQKKSKIFDVSNDAAKRVADIAARTIPLEGART